MHDLRVPPRVRLNPARAYATIVAYSTLLPVREARKVREAARVLVALDRLTKGA